MGESIEWNWARGFLRSRYDGGGAIKKMLPPIGTGDIWIAEVVKDGSIVRVEFRRVSTKRWAVLREERKEKEMAIVPDDLYPRHKVPDEIRECEGCHLKVIGRGDQAGWKGVDAGGGKMAWYCDKPACQQARDEFIAQRQVEMLAEQQIAQRLAENPVVKPVEQLSDEEALAEEQRLKSRLIALKVRKGQSTAQQDTATEVTVDDVVDPKPGPAENDAAVEQAFAGVTVHQTRDGVTSLCGAEGAIFSVGEELPDSCIPCVQCAEIFEAQVEEESPSKQADSSVQEPQETVGVYSPEAGEVSQKPFDRQSDVPMVDLEELPRFTPDLIGKIVAGRYDGGHILIPPSAYPDMNLEEVSLDRIRVGVSKMFEAAKVEVDRLVRARKNEKFIGLVFTLKAVPSVPAAAPEK